MNYFQINENALQLFKKISQKLAMPTKRMENKIIEKASYWNPEFQVLFLSFTVSFFLSFSVIFSINP